MSATSTRLKRGNDFIPFRVVVRDLGLTVVRTRFVHGMIIALSVFLTVVLLRSAVADAFPDDQVAPKNLNLQFLAALEIVSPARILTHDESRGRFFLAGALSLVTCWMLWNFLRTLGKDTGHTNVAEELGISSRWQPPAAVKDVGPDERFIEPAILSFDDFLNSDVTEARKEPRV